MHKSILSCSGLLILCLDFLAQPAVADPCLSREAVDVIQRRLGQVGALAFAAGTGLSLCSEGSSELEISLQRIDELSSSAEMHPEQLSCPASANVATERGVFHLVPQAAGFSSGPTKSCSCSEYKDALREAQSALRRLIR